MKAVPPSQTQTVYGGDIDHLILQMNEQPEQHTFLQSITLNTNEPATSPSGRKRKLADSFQPTTQSAQPTKKHTSYGTNNPNDPYIIADSLKVQNFPGLSYGVQFELARLITLGSATYERIELDEVLKKLQGTNDKSAALTARAVLSGVASASSLVNDPALAPEVAATSPWEELDKEEDMLAQCQYAGLGNNDIAPGWYGGKVDFRGKLERVNHSYTIKLERCTLGASCRFARRFGSRSFLRIKIVGQLLHESKSGLGDFFRKPFVLWGSIFRSFYAKDGSIFMYRTNELFVNGKVEPGQRPGLSLVQFLEWHNPMASNQKQAMTKWAARTALGLSNSVPGPRLEYENILNEDDIISSENSEMTDGCGLANRATVLAVSQKIGPEAYSVAFQFRLAGGKGMLVEQPNTSSREDFKVWIRPSQTKIRYTADHHDPLDPSFRTIDLLKVTYMRSPASISSEVIINLAENGVPHAYFVGLLRKGLEEIKEGYIAWDGPDSMYKLWRTVERGGGVLYSRRARESAGEARFRGYKSYEKDEEDEDYDEDGLDVESGLAERSTAWWADQISGCPSTLDETVMVLLDSGFSPKHLPVLREKLQKVLSTKIKQTASKHHYEVPLSAGAFAVPDHTGTLAPDEIYFRSSQRNLKTVEGLLTDLVLGDVVMLRYPCKLPTDARKIRAVENSLLRNYVDVVVCSVQGHRRLLDFLAGGDYDGDTVTVIWDPEVVQNFNNADEKYSIEPQGLDLCFESAGNENVAAFIQRTTSLPEHVRVQEMQSYLLGALRDPSIVGKYSNMHNNAVYNKGYTNPRTIKLAYKFCKVLDGAKTGLRIKSSTFKTDQGLYGSTHVRWIAEMKAKEKCFGPSNNQSWTSRGKNSEFIHGSFIMDVLDHQSKKERDRVLGEMEGLFSTIDMSPDIHLCQPWEEAVHMAAQGSKEVVRAKQEDLGKIKKHIQAMFQEHQAQVQKSFTSQAIEKRQDVLRSLSKKFHSYPTLDDLETFTDAASISRIRASYSYVYDVHQRLNSAGAHWTRFPWNLALRDLCHIKAGSIGPFKTVTLGFYERFKLAHV